MLFETLDRRFDGLAAELRGCLFMLVVGIRDGTGLLLQ
jgi:hypothetical protein